MIRNHARIRAWSRAASNAARFAAAALIAGTGLLAPPGPTQELPIRARIATAAGVDGGPVSAWGGNSSGQLGDGTTNDRSTPGQVGGVADIISVSAGRAHSVALRTDGTVWAWGANGYGELGRGAGSAPATPGPVPGLSGGVAISAGEYHTLALKSDGTVAVWGFHDNAYSYAPIAVKLITGVTAVAAGDVHSLALRSDGTVWSWGDNGYGQLGDGTTTFHYDPAPVPGLTNVRAIAARSTHSLALRNDGTVWAWGFNLNGVLGDGTTTNRSVPVRVSGIDRIVAISAGGEHNLALSSDGTVWAWGLNAHGGLGDGTTDARTTPVQTQGLSDVFSISAGKYESYAITYDWRLWAWGRGGSGQLGDGTTNSRPTPAVVGGLSNVSAVAGGDQFVLAITPTRPLTATVARSVPSQGAEVALEGGSAQDGGVTVGFKAGTLVSEANVILTSWGRSPRVITPPGGSGLVPRTIEVTAGVPLTKTVEITVNLTPAELSGRDINRLSGAVIVGDSLESRPTRVVNAAAGTLAITVDHFSKFTLFEAKVTPPALQTPARDATLTGFGTSLAWTNSPGVTQYHIQVVPFNGDGPGVNLIRDVESSFVVPAPPDWYGLLPDMTYTWRVRTATVPTSATEADWSAWATSMFRTPGAASTTVTAIAPVQGATVTTRTPALQWANSQAGVFYYEVQLSKDQTFTTDPAKATAMVYWVLLHGGVTTPGNTYVVPGAFPLEVSTTYYWRVRPRVQGDGTPAAWSQTWSFKAQ